MNSQNLPFVRSGNIPMGYRVIRAIARLGIWLFASPPHILNKQTLDQPGPTVLLVTHPRSLQVAVLLVAALDRQIHCLLPSRQLQGVFRRVTAWAVGVKGFGSLSDEQESLLNPCLRVLARQGTIVVFADQFSQNGDRRKPAAEFAARLTVEAILQGKGQVQPTLYPVHVLLGTERRGQTPLMCAGSPIQAEHFLPKVGENLVGASRHLVETIQTAIGANIFGLADAELERFNRELESVSREHLEEQWSRRQDWKQRVEELQLSSFAREWIDEQNCTDPARLVELREAMDAYREARRQLSMAQLIAETSGSWHSSGLRLAGAWMETVLGCPVALYGLINHLPAGIMLYASGLLKHSLKRDPKTEWLLRIFVVLSFYTIQIFLVHLWWGRATAGYYTLTLPISGAYLWRYRWLMRHRTYILFLKTLHPVRSARLLRQRVKILGKFDRELERSAQSLSTPYESSPGPAE